MLAFLDIGRDGQNHLPSLERIYNKPYDRIPFNPICEKCGKIGTTLAYEWDKKKEIVKYKCEENLVEWAKGCGYEGEVSPYNGERQRHQPAQVLLNGAARVGDNGCACGRAADGVECRGVDVVGREHDPLRAGRGVARILVGG